MTSHQLTQLRKVLMMPNLGNETMFDVLGRMQVLLEFFQRTPTTQNFIPFLQTYYIVTKAVAERAIEQPKYYRDFKSLERLDILFASLYFMPLLKYTKHTARLSPWQTYFQYCQQPHGNPFLQMLLGINAHINTDLVMSLVHVQYKSKADFLIINTVLADVIPEVMEFLAKHEYDIIAMGGLLFPKLTQAEFTTIIVRWREQAWANAQTINHHNYDQARAELCRQTEQVAQSLIDIFTTTHHPTQKIDQLHTLKVELKVDRNSSDFL